MSATTDQLHAEIKGMEILLQQNAALEQEVKRLCNELVEATLGVQKRGYLYKFREREIYYAPKWGLRYVVLQGSTLSYYGDESENRPRRTFDLSRCYVREEGSKKNGQFHVFAIYLGSDSDSADGEAQLLIRFSSDNSVEASLWIDMLEQACALEDESFHPAPIMFTQPLSGGDDSTPESKGNNDLATVSTSEADNGWTQTSIDHALNELDTVGLPLPILKRVQSSSLALQESIHRQLNARRVLSKRAPNTFTACGARLSSLPAQRSPQRKRGAGGKDSAPPPKAFPGYKPMHLASRPSPLSNEVRPGEFSFRGFFNLAVIILVLTHCDLIVNNINKYGFKLNPASFILPPSAVIDYSDKAFETSALLIHAAKSVATWFVSIFLCYGLESYASRNTVSEALLLAINFALGTFNIVAPCYWVWTSKAHPGANLVYLFQSVVIWMKLISYAHANKDLRVLSRRVKKIERESTTASVESDMAFMDINAKPFSGEQYIKTVSQVKDLQPPYLLYPQNISLKNLLYFCVAPTLCYQLNYPRTERISWRKVASLVARMLFVAAAIIFSVEQYVKPTLETVIIPMESGNVLGIAERLLKLSIPNTYVWLLGFYFYFHLWMNLCAELTRFGDRGFYKDWWNAKTIDRYWRTWNMPVHHWVTRHLYYPLIRFGCSKTLATFVVFMFSALMHEVVISFPFQHVYMYAFFGMLAQAPMIFITKYVDRTFGNSFLGNVVFWCSFCVVGQPMGVIMYYYDLYKLSMGPSAVTVAESVAASMISQEL